MSHFNRSVGALTLAALLGLVSFASVQVSAAPKDDAKTAAKAEKKAAKKVDAKKADAKNAKKADAKKTDAKDAKKADAAKQEAAPVAAPAEAQTPAFDMSIFDVPEGKDSAFYQEQMNKVIAAMQNLMRSQISQEDAMPIFEAANKAIKDLSEKLAFATDVDEEASFNAFQQYCSGLAQEGELDKLAKIIEDETAKDAKSNRVIIGQLLMIFGRIDKASRENKTDDLAAVVDDAVELSKTNDAVAQYFPQIATMISQADPKLGNDALDKGIAAFKEADDPLRKALVNNMESTQRFNNLVGSELLVEGLYLDGTEIDWESYRGKVVLVDFWATWCGPCVGEIPNVMKMYEKYHDAGFEVLGYSLDDDLDALKNFEENRKLPWKTASLKMSTEAKDKDYTDLTVYYGIETIPRLILVGRDGKVVDTNARGERLVQLLQELFPEVK